MELNQKVEKTLTSEQKVRFQRDNGKFKLLNNIVLLPIIMSLIGIYLESIAIVSIGIVCIIIFLSLKVCSFTKKNIVYENVIVPIILKEKFNNIILCEKNYDNVLDEFKKSNLISEYDKIKVEKYLVIKNEKYDINISKINVKKINIEENDGVVDKDLEEKLSGIFAYSKLPTKAITEFKVIKKDNEKSDNIVKIPNVDFDLKYDVFSQNPVEVRNILSPGVMARILEFNNKIDNIINFSIYEDMLYVSINYKDFLEFKGKGKKYVDEELAQENLEILEILDIFIRYFVNMY